MSVLTFGPADVDRLAPALASAPPNTRVTLAAGRYGLPAPLVLGRGMSLSGEPGQTILVGRGGGLLVTSEPGPTVRLADLTFEGGDREFGGAIRLQAGEVIEIDRCRFTRNRAHGTGGALYLAGIERATITRTLFEENESAEGGGAIVAQGGGVVRLRGCVFRANRSKVGGAIFLGAAGAIDVRQCTFVDNEASWPKGGGALFVLGAKSYGASGLVANSVFAGREAICADTSKQYEVFFRSSVVPAETFAQERLVNVAGNTLVAPTLVGVGAGLAALAAGSPGTGTTDPKFAPEEAADMLGRRYTPKGDPGALVRPAS